MSELHSTPVTPTNKPAKPCADYPLFAHAAGVWAKKICGKIHLFGPWSDSDRLAAKYLGEKGALEAGSKPRPQTDELKVKDACNAFLNAKDALLAAGMRPLTRSRKSPAMPNT